MSSDDIINNTSNSAIESQYEKIKKLMNELESNSDNFNSVILHQEEISRNDTSLISHDQNNNQANISKSIVITNPNWGFIKDDELSREKGKLL